MRLLVTRPDLDGERTAGALRARGHSVLLAPLLRMEMIPAKWPEQDYAAVVLTSANAARAIQTHAQRGKLILLPVFTVGPHTTEAAQAAGFSDVQCGNGDKEALAKLLSTRFSLADPPILYLAGEDRAGDLELALSAAKVITAVVYRMAKTQSFPVEVISALAQRQIDGVLHFSRRSAETYLDCAGAAGITDRALEPLHYCLSRQVAGPLAAAGAVGIEIAPVPNEEALIDLLKSTSGALH
jgi:uroporphyrinogen-III synthase